MTTAWYGRSVEKLNSSPMSACLMPKQKIVTSSWVEFWPQERECSKCDADAGGGPMLEGPSVINTTTFFELSLASLKTLAASLIASYVLV